MRFEDVLDIKNGKNQKAVENPDGIYPIYGSGGIMGYADQYICDSNTVIIGRKGSINNPIFVETPFWNVDTAFGLVAKPDKLIPKYLYYFCKYFDFDKLNTTVTIPSLTKANLLKIKIKVPELDQQKKEVEVLDKVNQVIEKRKKQLNYLDDLIKSRFVEMFGDIKNNVVNCPVKKIADFTEVLTGATPNRAVPEYFGGNIPWVKTGEISKGHIFEAEEYITEKAVNETNCKLLPSKTIMIAMYGQGKTRGQAGVLEIEASTNQACAAILPNLEYNTLFMFSQLDLRYDDLREMGRGGNQPNLNLSMVKNFEVLYPKIELQNQFAIFVQHVDKLKVELKKSLDEMQLLFDSLMQQYFE